MIIDNDVDKSIAYIFVFGMFGDKNSGIVYHDLMGLFPFMSLDGSVCFFLLYHFELNCILANPIMGLDNTTIFNAYEKQLDALTKRGFTRKLKVMDNQATNYIKHFLNENKCKLQLVEPHNHRIDAAEQAIQSFKDVFIVGLATTDSNFPLQLWDKLTPQVQNTLNMMRDSHVNPAILANEALNGLYSWNRYPLAPLGCKAMIYTDGDTRGSWASGGVGGRWLVSLPIPRPLQM